MTSAHGITCSYCVAHGRLRSSIASQHNAYSGHMAASLPKKDQSPFTSLPDFLRITTPESETTRYRNLMEVLDYFIWTGGGSALISDSAASPSGIRRKKHSRLVRGKLIKDSKRLGGDPGLS